MLNRIYITEKEGVKMKIVITKRSDDYHACIEGRPEIWGCGPGESTAIGDLIRSHKDVFKKIGLEVEIIEDAKKRKPMFPDSESADEALAH